MIDLKTQEQDQELSHYDYHVGRGNWQEFDLPLDRVFEAASEWSSELSGVERPWLCWHVDPDWCLVQQRLVSAFGWTPVVGGDPRAGQPNLIRDAIYIDFNKTFKFPVMFPHFVIEFAFLFCDRLAFWHSDLLIRESKMEYISQLFSELPNGSMAATLERGGIRNRLNYRRHRFWELLGCTTRLASENLFKTGCGWWINFYNHPNCPSERETTIRSKYSWEYGTGIMYWKKKYKGDVREISSSILREGHFTRINNQSYKTRFKSGAQRDLAVELPLNFDLEECCNLLFLENYLGHRNNDNN